MASLHAIVLTLASLGGGETVLLDFTATWCGPCRQMAPLVHRLAKQGHPVRQVDIDQHRDLATKFGVRGIPCFVMLVDGREVDRVVGATSGERLEQMLAKGRGSTPSASVPTQRPGAAAKARGFPPRENGPFSEPARARQAIQIPATKATQPLRREAVEHTPRSDLESRLLAASVRLKINDPDGHSYGSGTIIDTRGGSALILTCGHIFRDSRGRGEIVVDLFGPGAPQGIPGRLVGYDLDRDVGLVSIRPGSPVTPIPIAPSDYRVDRGDNVVSVGCDNGRDPSIQHSRVTSINKYQGPPNLQVAGQPIVGRSGGGLFSQRGCVIGVCNSADPMDNEGLYAALDAIRAELDRHRLTAIHQRDSRRAPLEPPESSVALREPPAMASKMPSASRLAALQGSAADRNPQEHAAQQLLDAHKAAVVCVIRDPLDPRAAPRVITLDRASPLLLRELAAQETRDGDRQLTSKKRADEPRQKNVRAPFAMATTRAASSTASPAWTPRWISRQR